MNALQTFGYCLLGLVLLVAATLWVWRFTYLRRIVNSSADAEKSFRADMELFELNEATERKKKQAEQERLRKLSTEELQREAFIAVITRGGRL